MFESNFIHSILLLYVNLLCLYEIVLKLNGDIKHNPRPTPSSNQILFICHGNLKSISVHNYINVSLLKAYIFTHKCDVICISEAYLDSDTSDDDGNLKLGG